MAIILKYLHWITIVIINIHNELQSFSNIYTDWQSLSNILTDSLKKNHFWKVTLSANYFWMTKPNEAMDADEFRLQQSRDDVLHRRWLQKPVDCLSRYRFIRVGPDIWLCWIIRPDIRYPTKKDGLSGIFGEAWRIIQPDIRQKKQIRPNPNVYVVCLVNH